MAIALLLSLEDRSPELAIVKPIAYGVVLLSIALQGGTIGLLARLLLPEPRRPEAPEKTDTPAARREDDG